MSSCGYSSLQESWAASDGLRWIPDITTPTLMVSAKDDPFLDPQYALRPCACSLMAQSCSMRMGAATHLLMHPLLATCSTLYSEPADHLVNGAGPCLWSSAAAALMWPSC